MLIQFSVTNFMSIKDEQVFSMVASKNKELIDSNTFDKSGMKLLRAAAIYGPNAAGKTNLLLALDVMTRIVSRSASEKLRGELLPVAPFKLHPGSRNAPCKFEVMFIVEGIRYQYGFSATKEHITEEWLFVYPEKRPQRWFTRSRKQSKYEWKFGPSFTGEKKLWQTATRDNALFLSTAIQLNSQQLQPVYDWFKITLRYINATKLKPYFSVSLCMKATKEDILDFLNQADLDIKDIYVKEETLKETFGLETPPVWMPDDIKQILIKESEKEKIYRVGTIHQDIDGKPVALDMGDESDGTQKMFSLAGHWITSLKEGYVICFDELHDNLHPMLVRFLVRLFNNPETNPNNAQLIFTTHETNILSQEILRRDQIWFCEKDETQATQVFPLTDFSPRKGRENLESAYLSDRYGALPYVQEN